MNVYFCQFSDELGDNIYLPYSVGFIISYLRSIKKFEDYNYKILFIKDDINRLAVNMETPDYLFISAYMWNFNYSIEFAKIVKIYYPKCKIILGGHHSPFDSRGFFEKYNWIDIITHADGEKICEDILYNKPINEINNISYNHNGKTIKNDIVFENFDINLVPSPYLSGVFDNILKMPYKFTASLETNRGCPYSCTYCDWGNTNTMYKKMRFFNKERIMKEIKWFGQNKIEFLFGCDSNFGLIKSDMDYINMIIRTNFKYGYPKKFRVCYAKNSNDFILHINKKLNKFGLSKGATLSFQSLNENVLAAIKRKNMRLKEFIELIKKYEDENIPTYTELILGLPEETINSFKNGINILLECGQHSSIVIYLCQVLPNSLINSERHRKKYGIKSLKMPAISQHTDINRKDIILEEEEIIIGTKTMNEEEHIDCCMFGWIVQCMHCLGITQLIAKYICKETNANYKNFYNYLLNKIKFSETDILSKEYYNVYMKYKNLHEGQALTYTVKETAGFNWPIEEGSFLNLMKNKKIVYIELLELIYGFCKLTNIEDVFELNEFLIRDFDKNKNEKILLLNKEKLKILKTIKFKHNLTDMIIIRPLQCFDLYKEYANQVIWYGRKGGKFFYTRDEII